MTTDPLLKHSRREAVWILAVWLLSCLFTGGFCYLHGYLAHDPDPNSVGPAVGQMLGPLASFDRHPETLSTPLGLGIPDWVFYGIAVPWCVCVAITLWFCGRIFHDDDLGVAPESVES